MSELFSAAAHWAARQMGQASTFAIACLLVIIWGASGPLFHFSDTWQLVINTGTTIVTFLMVFLLQHAQNRDSAAIQLKLDELIRVNQDARNKLLALEDLSEGELDRLKGAFVKIAAQAPLAVDLGDVREDLQEAKEGIEDAQSAITRVVSLSHPLILRRLRTSSPKHCLRLRNR